MTKKKIEVKPGKTQSKVGFFVGICFVIIGLVIAIPTFGLFGIIWTGIACFGCYENYKNGFTDEGVPSYEIAIEDNEDIAVNDIETRLKKLEHLYNEGLITPEEYTQKRKEILEEI